MPVPEPADRNLLFGLFALQNGMIDQSVLVAAFHAWTRDKSRSIAEILLGQGAIDADDRSLLEGLVTKHLRRHGDDVEKSLAAVSAPRSVVKGLGALGDENVNATLGHVGSGSHPTAPDDDRVDADATTSLGRATGDGQRFRVLRPHARGGLGAVFVALDAELNREVALKQILDQHADDPTSRTRFVLEAEITGGLEHPGIVPVYGLGSDGGGRPYYAMRFIRGDSLKDAIAAFHADNGHRGTGFQPVSGKDTAKMAVLRNDPGLRSLALRELLRRFVDVCNAIEYAHTRGVIHRDIKPANIIVGNYGETLVVDWGLAKAIGKTEPNLPSDERTLMPSSSSGSAETLPGSALGTPAYMSPEQAVGDLDRLGPRSDVYSLGATLYCLLTGKPPFEGDDLGEVLRAVGKGDFPRPRSVDPSIDPALEAVCLKAMATKPEGRYASGRALADDIERWAADEPVAAYAEPWVRRMSRWLSRHRTGVTGIAAATLAGVIGLTAVLAVQAQANGRLTRANSSLEIANRRVTQANTDLKLANEREKQRFDLAMEAIKLFEGEVGDDLVLKSDQFKPLRDRLLQSAVDFYKKLQALLKDSPDPAARKAMGDAYFQLGELTEKISYQAAALAIHREALLLRRALASEPGADEETKLDVARSLKAIGVLQKNNGDVPGARASLEEAVRLAQEVSAQQRVSGQARRVLGMAYHYLASLLDAVGDDAGSLALYDKALAIRRQLVDADPNATPLQLDLALTYNNIGMVQDDIGERTNALDSYRQALAIHQKLADANPQVSTFQFDLARTHKNIGALQAELRKNGEGLVSARRALDIAQRLTDANPSVIKFKEQLASIHTDVSLRLSAMGDEAGALAALGKAQEIQEKLVDANPGATYSQRDLAMTLAAVAVRRAVIGDNSGARAAFLKALAIDQKLVDDNPGVIDFRLRLVTTLVNYSESLRLERNLAEAREGYERAIAIMEPLFNDNPKSPYYRTKLAYTLRVRGVARLGLSDLAGAAADTRRSLGMWSTIAKPVDWELLQIACCHATLSVLAGRAGSGIAAHEASSEADQAIVNLRQAVGLGFRELAEFRTETALDTLRGREDFRALMMDVAFPTDPFDRAH